MGASITADVFGAVADRRTRDLRYRQRQLISLHRWISKHLAELESAMSANDGLSSAETQFVIALALYELKRSYNSLDLRKELDIEFRIKDGRDNIERSLPEEIVYVIPDNFTLFYSVMNTLCAAVAAGSCCIVELSNNLRGTPGLVQKMIFESLDNLSFGTVNTRPKDDFLKKCLVVDQQNCVSPETTKWLIKSQVTTCAVAIVDRTADVAAAAKAIAISTLLFAGKGPYTPNFILINEFLEIEFSQFFGQYMQEAMNGATNEGSSKKPIASSNTLFTRLKNGEDIDVGQMNKTRKPQLLAFSSLDYAIDLVSSKISPPLLASYVFADPKSAKYLAQFIRADVSFINHIPASLLVGPAAPSGYPASPTARYRREMIEFPSPQFFQDTSGSISVDELANRDSMAAKGLLTASLQPLKPMGQPREGDMNFFVQGLKASFALYIYLPLTITAGGIVWYGVKSAYRYWK